MTTAIDHLTPQQRRELLTRLLNQRPVPGAPPAPPAPPTPPAAPLSCPQQRLWLVEQMQPTGAAYNNTAWVRIDGPLDPRWVQESVGQVVRRHAALRTVFPTPAPGQALAGKPPVAPGIVFPAPGTIIGEAMQTIRSDLPIPVGLLDLTAEPAARRARLTRDAVADQAGRVFDLARGPLLRVALVRWSARRHVLVLVIHHLVSDGWSMGILAGEVAAGCVARAQGREPDLAPLPIQYADYARWQVQQTTSPAAQRDLAYWRKKLVEAPTFEPPTGRTRPRVQRYRGAHRPVRLSPRLSEAVRAFSRERGRTPFMTLLTAWGALLMRLSGQDDLTIGTPIANRDRPELEGMIGFVVNMLVLRLRHPPGATFEQLLEQAGQTALEAYDHQAYPFEKLVEHLHPRRDPSRNPLFQTTLAVHPGGVAPPAGGGLRFSPPALPGFGPDALDVPSRFARFDLELHLWDVGERISGTLAYNTDLLDRETADALVESFTAVLTCAVRNPRTPVARLALVSPRQTRTLKAWGVNRKTEAAAVSIDGLFDRQADARPDAVALIQDDRRMTYGQLQALSRRVAGSIGSRAARRGEVVGLLLPRGIDAVAAMLGVLRCGGAYLPLDPSQPVARTRFMLDDAGARLVVTDRAHADTAAALGEAVAIEDAAQSALAAVEPAAAGPDDAAYVMYTSGSTGTPKGVAVPHRGVTRLVHRADYVRMDRRQVVGHLAPLGFDASTFEVWAPLLSGGRCVIAAQPLSDAPALRDLIGRHGVTTLWLTAALFNAIADQDAAALAGLRQLLIGGEAISAPHVARVQARSPGLTIFNGYGPTETTTFAAVHRVPPLEADAADPVPIGRPINRTDLWVLDAAGRLLPPHVAGELFIGGDGVALGYLGRADLTARRFVRAQVPGRPRVYRTGDLVRWNGRGELEFLGRNDDQVKLRGFRIEPGEIEAHLRALPGVDGATVVPRGEGAAMRLVAYVAAAAGAVDADDLRARLHERLPSYMVPAQFVTLDALPLNTNGKVDRARLPEPAAARSTPGHSPPATAIERRIAGVWQEVLGVSDVGRTDNFFDLGGHSLLLVRARGEIRAAVGRDVAVLDLFRFPTVAALAQHLSAEGGGSDAVSRARQRALRQQAALQTMGGGRDA